MSRRIEIELTSAQGDGTWTWRAAGALKPRGVLDEKLLYEGAKVGDVVKAEADFEIEGIAIVAVSPPQTRKRAEPDRIEVLGPGRADGPPVTTQLVGRTGGRSSDRRRDREDRPRDRQPSRPPRSDGPRGDRPRTEAPRPSADGADRDRQARPSGDERKT
ncbi:MAG: hypothetical protein M3R71_03725, partial [Actinomycetota bacterium]|nr:hypothetical protein [Actinomycetota bacterium]